MKKHSFSLVALTVLALAACGPNREEQAAQEQAKADAEAEAALPPPPPPVTASATYRCADNTIAYVDFYGNNGGASVRVGEETATPVRVAAAPAAPAPAADAAQPAEAAKPGQFVSEDGQMKLEGSGATITLTLPGKAAQSCKS